MVLVKFNHIHIGKGISQSQDINYENGGITYK